MSKTERTIFKDFAEYWFYAKWMNIGQRDAILSSLPKSQYAKLMKSYKDGGWEDLTVRNEIDKIVDDIKKDIDLDIISIRCKIMNGKSVYLKKSQWDYVIDMLKSYKTHHTFYVLGNILSQEIDGKTVLLTKK